MTSWLHRILASWLQDFPSEHPKKKKKKKSKRRFPPIRDFSTGIMPSELHLGTNLLSFHNDVTSLPPFHQGQNDVTSLLAVPIPTWPLAHFDPPFSCLHRAKPGATTGSVRQNSAVTSLLWRITLITVLLTAFSQLEKRVFNPLLWFLLQ